MAKINLSELSIAKVRELSIFGGFSARELVEIYHRQIEEKDKDIHAYLEIFQDAYQQAEELDKRVKQGESPAELFGVPFAVKDNILIKDKKVSAASKILESYHASYDASVIKKLRAAGAVFLGRTNMDEFAMGSSCENSAFGQTKNPYDLERVPGGSSGGSAAAVASQMCLAALGSDTGGSVREPAAFCGIVGLKPTYGAVSRFGLIAMASSLDQIGPLAKNIGDAEAIFNVIKGRDPKDSTSADYKIKKCGAKPRVGVPKEFFSLKEKGKKGLDQDVSAAINRAIEILRSLDCEIKEVSLPSSEYALACYYIVMPAEVSSNLARYDGVRFGQRAQGKILEEIYAKTRGELLGQEARRRVILGTYALSAGYYEAYYGRAQKARWLIKKDFEKVFQDVDILLSPTTAAPAFKLGEKSLDPLSMYLSDIFTVPANLAGVPALSLPFSQTGDEKRLPIGIQLTAPWFYEGTLFETGKLLEKNN
ncbi:MAG: Asp-tRNA(Asn)/Glu-tRNA(Gln) amidotransferase subunit GatA [Candidatus Niyogibacteria bacterium]|nr:Asp-tRNA(Asn)/Glu-tRNA(Gln) amidotransferase subunit GatA [Candidatus Niyogibacteria bacterium]